MLKKSRLKLSSAQTKQHTMADRRPDNDDSNPRSKRQKTNGAEMDPSKNPYLAHHYDEENGYSNGYGHGYSSNNNNSASKTNFFGGLTRHNTTAEQAKALENGPNNPFTGKPLSKRFFSILETRRNLPVHTQRLVAYLRQPDRH